MAVGGQCHVPASLTPRRAPIRRLGGRQVPSRRLPVIALIFPFERIKYSTCLTPHIPQPGQERSDSKPVLHCQKRVPHHSAANCNTDNGVIQTCAYYYYYAALVWHSVHLWREKKATSPCCEKLRSNKIFTFFKYVLSHRFLLMPPVTKGKFVYLAQLGSRCTDTSIFPIQRAVLTSTMGYKK
jgi:hypothetical protein